MRPEVPIFLEFLVEWKTSKQIKEHFDMSNTEFHNLSKWLLKVKAISKIKGNLLPGHTNKSFLYKTISK